MNPPSTIKVQNETSEALMRIPVLIVSGFVLGVWKTLVGALLLVNFFITLFTDKRNREIAAFCEIWNTQTYVFLRYMSFVSNERPFPFRKMTKNLSKFS